MRTAVSVMLICRSVSCSSLTQAPRMKCEEAEDESESRSTEKFYQLSCFIEKGRIVVTCLRKCGVLRSTQKCSRCMLFSLSFGYDWMTAIFIYI